MAILIDAKDFFLNKRRCKVLQRRICMPIEMKWACPSCGELSTLQGGCYEIFFVVQRCTAGEMIILRGICPACGEENNHPAPYL